MKVFNKKDKIYLIVLLIVYISIIFFIVKDKYYFGSKTDWNMQISVIPEYFRSLFYKSFNIVPDIAFNLGSGQNIFHYAYYGLCNPIILLSYFLPFVSMKTYIQASSILIIYVSSVLFYYYLKSNKYSENISFIGSLMLMFSSPLIFHAHRQIMFINYFPFLILSLIGVDKYFKNGNTKLLCISLFLLILSSYYYSISSIIVITIYYLYKYLSLNKKINIKILLKDAINIIKPMLISILLSSFLILPVYYALKTGRVESNQIVKLSELLLPSYNLKHLLYSPYGIGLTSILFISIIYLLLSKKKNSYLLSITLLLIFIFPIFNYLLNGMLYINSKSLIPFIPLAILIVMIFINKLFNKNIDGKMIALISLLFLFISFLINGTSIYYFYIEFIITLIVILVTNKYKTKKVFTIYMTILLICVSLLTNSKDNLVVKYDKENDTQKILNKIDDSFNHTVIYNNRLNDVNNIYGNTNIYQNYIYASSSNKDYNNFYYNIFGNAMEHRDKSILSANNGLLFLMYSNSKYVISDKFNIKGYEKINSENDLNLYKNDNVLPYMYVSYNTFNYKELINYSFAYKQEILLNNTIIEDRVNNNYVPNVKETHIKRSNIKYVDISLKIDNYLVNSSKNDSRLIIDLGESYKNKIMFISFDINNSQSCNVGDLYIKINDQTNKLSCKEWKYYNDNTTFTYTLSDKDLSKFDIYFSKGIFDIKSIKVYELDYDSIKDIKNKVDELVIDKSKSDSNTIYGTVEAKKDGYLVTNLPYDKGYKVKINNKEVPYERVNTYSVGIKVKKGVNNISISYHAPYKRLGISMSILGIILYIIIYHNKIIKKIKKI